MNQKGSRLSTGVSVGRNGSFSTQARSIHTRWSVRRLAMMSRASPLVQIEFWARVEDTLDFGIGHDPMPFAQREPRTDVDKRAHEPGEHGLHIRHAPATRRYPQKLVRPLVDVASETQIDGAVVVHGLAIDALPEPAVRAIARSDRSAATSFLGTPNPERRDETERVRSLQIPGDVEHGRQRIGREGDSPGSTESID